MSRRQTPIVVDLPKCLRLIRMKIESVKTAIPSRKVTNQDVVSIIEQKSKKTFQGNLDDALDKVLYYLKYSGSDSRFWLAPEETPIQLLANAVDEAIEEAGCQKKDIDLLIYTGVDRGFLEPGGSYHCASALGINQVHCFDILDACMSWTRALYLVNSLLERGDYQRALIINMEFNISRKETVRFALPNMEAIEWSFPGYTVGEAATATIVSREPEREWEFHFASRVDFSDLCNIPLNGFQDYCNSTEHIGKNGIGHFTSFGVEMHKKGAKQLLNVFRQLEVKHQEISAIFPHASSKMAWNKAAKALNVDRLMWHIYPEYGNLVSASIPTGIASAIEAKRIQRGDKIVGWIGSAGMSFCTFSSIY